MKLTDKETKVMKVIAESLDSWRNGGEPGYSDYDVWEIAFTAGMSQKQVDGVISSLTKKKVVFTMDMGVDNWTDAPRKNAIIVYGLWENEAWKQI